MAITFFKFAELGLILLAALFIITQIFVPLMRGTPFFPLLRFKVAMAAGDLAEAVEDREVSDITKQAKAIRESLDATKQTISADVPGTRKKPAPRA